MQLLCLLMMQSGVLNFIKWSRSRQTRRCFILVLLQHNSLCAQWIIESMPERCEVLAALVFKHQQRIAARQKLP